MRYEEVMPALRAAYDGGAEGRDRREVAAWKVALREQFLARLRAAGATTLLEVGAGPGRDSLFFQQQGLRVTCTDLSPEMVRLARAKGLDARVADFLSLPFADNAFDALFAMNCLLHVPKSDLPAVLARLRRLLVPGGLFFLALYGGPDEEGPRPDDDHQPPRFFASYSDAALQAALHPCFEQVEFRTITVERAGPYHLQALTLRRPPAPA